MIATIYGVTLRTQARKGRLIALGLLGLVGILIGVAVGLSDRADPVPRRRVGGHRIGAHLDPAFIGACVHAGAAVGHADRGDEATARAEAAG